MTPEDRVRQARWYAEADRLDEYARTLRREGYIKGPEGAEDAEAAALDYRRAADAIGWE